MTKIDDAASMAASESVSGKPMTIFEKFQTDKAKAKFALALPEGFGVERYVALVLLAIRANDKLQQCTFQSLFEAMLSAAAMGLEPNSPLHEAAVIPYKNKATFQPEYRGLLKMAWNSGLIDSISYNKVCENDEFEYEEGMNQVFKFRRALRKERGEVYAYFAFAHLKDGGIAFVIKSKEEIESHARRFSKAYHKKDAPWQTDFDAMAIKTVLIELCDKKLPRRTTNEAIRFHQMINAATEMDEGRSEKVDLSYLMDEPTEVEANYQEIPPEQVEEPEPIMPPEEEKQVKPSKPEPEEEAPVIKGKLEKPPVKPVSKPEPEVHPEKPEKVASTPPESTETDTPEPEPEPVEPEEMPFMGDAAYKKQAIDLCNEIFAIGGNPADILQKHTGGTSVDTERGLSSGTKMQIIADLKDEKARLSE